VFRADPLRMLIVARRYAGALAARGDTQWSWVTAQPVLRTPLQTSAMLLPMSATD
jgi:hypothetical protein